MYDQFECINPKDLLFSIINDHNRVNIEPLGPFTQNFAYNINFHNLLLNIKSNNNIIII